MAFKNAILLFDGHQRSINWTRAQLKEFSLKLRRHKVTYVRVCPYWWDDRVPNMPMPFLKNGSYYDLDKPNPVYDEALRQFARWVHAGPFWKRVISGTPEVWFDLFDNCASGRPWSPWVNNLQGIHGIYEYNDKAIGYYKAWIRRIFGILGRRAHYGYNELYFPAWQNVAEANKWGERWVLELANYMKSLGMRFPFSFSADMSVGGTASRIIGWLTEEKTQYKIAYYPTLGGGRIAQYVFAKNPDEARQCMDARRVVASIEETGIKISGGYGGRDGRRLIHVVHGMGLPEHWEEVWASNVLSGNVGLGVSEDGVGMGSRIIPPHLRGHCEEPNIRCGVNRPGFVSMVRRVLATRWAGDRLRLVERMPKEIAMSYRSIDLLDEDVSLGVFDDL